MEKIINVAVSGSELEQSTNFGGIQGEGGARHLKISFDEEWSAYSKSVTFLDANLENPVKILLTTANLDADGTYLVAIPKTALLTGGKLTYIIEGVMDGAIQRSVSKELKVKYAPEIDADSLDGVITPTEADQLNLSIQNEAERIDALEEAKSDLEESFLSLSESVNKQLLSKADTSYVEAALSKKADSTDVAINLSKKADTLFVEDALLSKADTLYVAENLSKKADTSYVAQELLNKADKTDVAKELSQKADTSYVAKELLNKADSTYVAKELSKKADKTYTDDALSYKADITYVDNIASSASRELEALKTEDKKHTDDISVLDERLKNQEEYIAQKTDEMFDRNNVVANALCGKLSGAIATADDVSPIEHNTDVKVRSKNLIKFTDRTQEQNGVTFSRTGGVITANGTATETVATLYVETVIEKSGIYSCSGAPVGSGPQTYALFFVHQKKDGTKIYYGDYGTGKTVYVEAGEILTFYIQIQKGVTAENVVFKPQIEFGEKITPFTPFVDVTTAVVTRCAKNLANVPETSVESANAWGSRLMGKFLLPSGTYTLSMDFVQEGEQTLIGASAKQCDNINVSYGESTSGDASGRLVMNFTIPDGEFGADIHWHCNRSANVLNSKCTFSNVQVEKGSTATEFEPYTGGKMFVPSSGGILENVTSITPCMTLVANTKGVTIYVEYNKDTNKVIEKLINAIISLGGNI